METTENGTKGKDYVWKDVTLANKQNPSLLIEPEVNISQVD